MPDDKVTSTSLGEAVELARPPGDALARAELRGRIGAALFGELQQPVRLGRFVLLERLGQGGMGVVYAAYDSELDRRVALKLLHQRAGRGSDQLRRRLLREARAAARLSHPNLCPVYDVGLMDETVFLVMEFVVGQTLRAWLARASRSWREVLDAYVQAGQGLAAAHAAGVVHRDFKPDNALIGDDGRVRVVDFGLARQRGDTEPVSGETAEDHPPTLTGSMTATGLVMGTPLYMAPEQFDGSKVGPAADQFAFCVALYEGLYGQRPFAAGTLHELEKNVRAGRVREPPRDRRVPRWIHAALGRGLQPQASDRYRSMSALLGALTRDPRRRVRPWLYAIAFAIVAAAAIAGLEARRGSAFATCAGGRDALAMVWGADRRARVERAILATGRPFATATAPRVLAGLDGYGAVWVDAGHDACVRHARGEQSALMLDQRMRCLDGRLRALDSAAAVLAQIDDRSVVHAPEVVANLPPIATCADVDALAAEVPPPDDPTVIERVKELRSRLSRAKALEDAGRYDEARKLDEAIVSDAEVVGYGPALAESLLAQGRNAMMLNGGAFEAAVGPLRQASNLGVQHRMWALAVEALARRFFAQGKLAATSPEIDALIPLAEALSVHVADRGLARPLLYNNIGIAYMNKGDREHARAYFERALGEMERAPETPLELSSVRKNLAMLTPDAARRESLMQQELERLEHRLGENHPWTLNLRLAYAHYTADLRRARALLAPACDGFERFHPDQLRPWISCLYYLGFLTAELGDRAQAAGILEHAGALGSSLGATDLGWGELAFGYALYLRGEQVAALDAMRRVKDRFSAQPDDWWIAQRIAHARLGMGLAEQALGRRQDAIRDLEYAAGAFEKLRTINQDVEHDQRLMVAHRALAELGRGAAPPPVTSAKP